MQVILLDKIVNLGNLGEIVKVKDGYARNFLIPSGRARRATEAAKAEFEARRAELEKQAADKLAAAQAQGEKLKGSTVKLTQKAGVDGHLLGGHEFIHAACLDKGSWKREFNEALRLGYGMGSLAIKERL